MVPSRCNESKLIESCSCISRSIIEKDQISAKVEDGILTITMPKTEPKEKVTKAIEVS